LVPIHPCKTEMKNTANATVPGAPYCAENFEMNDRITHLNNDRCWLRANPLDLQIEIAFHTFSPNLEIIDLAQVL